MIELKNYLAGQWQAGLGEGHIIKHAVSGQPVARCGTEGVDFKAALEWGRSQGGASLRALTFRQRGELLAQMVSVLRQHLPEFYDIAATYGATKTDARGDIEGGIGTLNVYAELGRRELPDCPYLTDGELVGLSPDGGFGGQHLYVSRRGLLVQINAYNYPAWGMLEKLGPSLLAGLPSLVKPAPQSAWLTVRMIEVLLEAGVVPEGGLQVAAGGPGDLLDHVTGQDVIAFTGSAETSYLIKSHPNVVRSGVRLNIETDSLNAAILGQDVEPHSPLFNSYINEVFKEMTYKAGQKCTAIRRIIVPEELAEPVAVTLRDRLKAVSVGDPAKAGVTMGALVDHQAVDRVRQKIGQLAQEADIIHGAPKRIGFVGGNSRDGAFMEPILLFVHDSEKARLVHEIEPFGPVATVVPYQNLEQAIALTSQGNGSLVTSIFTGDLETATRLTLALAPYNGRLMVITDEAAASQSTGHGIAMPLLIHGGPGRAGGGEELGGLRSVYHYLQRVAIQGSPVGFLQRFSVSSSD